jgi:mannose-6-phosphate isomerase-like protein (cupin superfamily)
MPNHTKVNLKEVENLAEKHGFAPALEARFATGALDLEKAGLSLQRLAPDARLPFGHRHAEQEEIYVVLSGGGRMALDDAVIEVRAYDAIRVAPDVKRAFEAGPEGIEYLAFGAPSGAGPGSAARDAEQLPGWWAGAEAD